MLKYKADRRAVFFMLVTMAFFVANWMSPSFNPLLFFGTCFMACIVFVMVHNHNHTPMWKSAILNKFQDYWLTVFYGYPVFAWIPTHNMNHHVLGNKAGDDSMTYMHTESNNLWSILSYPFVTGKIQQRTNNRFIKSLWAKDRRRCLYYLSQALVLVLFVLGGLILDWKKALLYIVIPQQISLNFVLFVNYMQHVHADEESRWNHSRNFVSALANWFMMNNGYHTIHHEKPLQHWSLNEKGHATIEHHIVPELKQQSLLGYIVKTYFLSPFVKSYRSQSMRLARIEQEKSQQRGETPVHTALSPEPSVWAESPST